MMRDNGGTAGAVLVGFVLGAAAGAALALLTTPCSGDEMRQRLSARAQDARAKAAESARQGREFLNRQRETVATAIDKGLEAYEQARSGAAPVSGEEPL
jgi:gas vesicle protein